MTEPPARDPWTHLTGLTAARIALGRAGPALPTREVLALALAHAQARDAVHAPFDADALARDLEALGHATLQVASAAPDRATYLRRPDLGRRLSGAGRETLERSGWKVSLLHRPAQTSSHSAGSTSVPETPARAHSSM